MLHKLTDSPIDVKCLQQIKDIKAGSIFEAGVSFDSPFQAGHYRIEF